MSRFDDASQNVRRENIAAYQVPARIDLVQELPKSATGKILKRVLRDHAGAA